MSNLEEIQITLLEIFTKNKNHFKNNNLDIYNKIMEFEKLDYENYFIDFVDNHFELMDSNKNKIYNCDPFYDANYRVKNIINENMIDLISSNITKSVHYDDGLNAYKFASEYISFVDTDVKINKFIFIGTLLGVHINDIDNKISAKSYLIIEPNIEIFRLSMFLTDYSVIGTNSKVFFCIGFEEEELEININKFYNYEYRYNTKIQFELASQKELYLLDDISIKLMQNNPMTYPFSEYMLSMKRGYRYLKECSNGILNINSINDLFKNKPILYLGAGPSISKSVEWIYLNQDRFIIVASSAILKKLELLSIIPDVIIVIDGQKDVILKQFDVSSCMYDSSIIFASIKIDTNVFKKLNSDKLYLIQDSFELFVDYGILTGVTVGDIGISLLLKLGVKKLYLFGFDACIEPISGKTHDSCHHSSRKINTKNKGNTYSNHIVKVKGNFLDEVDTFIFYTGMIDNISNILLLSNSKVFNLSNGAYFKNSTPLKKEDINFDNLELIDKVLLQDEIVAMLNNNLKKELDKNDLDYIKKEKKILDKVKRLKIKNIEQSISKLKSSYKNSVTIQILEKFLYLTSPYKERYNNEELQFKQLQKVINEFESINKELV